MSDDGISCTWADWARRERVRWCVFVVVALGVAFVAVTAAAALLAQGDQRGNVPLIGLLLLLMLLLLVVPMAWWHATERPVLTLDHRTVRYAARNHEVAASWKNVSSIEDQGFRRSRGPVLVLREDALVAGDPGVLGAVLSVERPDGSTIPLAPFIDLPFEGSWLEAELRRHIPELVDDYLERAGTRSGLPMPGTGVEPTVYRYARWARLERQVWDLVFPAIIVALAVATLALVGGPLAMAFATLMGSLAAFDLYAYGGRRELFIHDGGVTYRARNTDVAGAWDDADVIEDHRNWRGRGPTLIFRGEYPQRRRTTFKGARRSSSEGAADATWGIPLMPFAERPFEGTELERQLRSHIPDILAAYQSEGGRPATASGRGELHNEDLFYRARFHVLASGLFAVGLVIVALGLDEHWEVLNAFL